MQLCFMSMRWSMLFSLTQHFDVEQHELCRNTAQAEQETSQKLCNPQTDKQEESWEKDLAPM